MKEFRIVSVNTDEYGLVDYQNRPYKLSASFYELGQKPKVGWRIFMAPELLDKNYFEYSDFYYFGKPGSIYGRGVSAKSYDIDIIELEIDGERFRQQRHYG